jgi:hypothetical protein
MQQLIGNRIQTPDGTILQSFNRHDYKEHLDANGEVYIVDGGLEYQRRSLNQEPATDLSVYVGDDHTHIRTAFHWGTYGKCGTLPRRWVALKDLDTDHIVAILDTQSQIAGWLRDVFNAELQFRVAK